MTEPDLHRLVQGIVDRHLRERGRSPAPAGGTPGGEGPDASAGTSAPGGHAPGATHPSFVLIASLVAPGGAVGDGACVIEPAVRCTHCGYCQSYGH